jgi:iron complex transport system substrate-binding protein
MRIVSTMPAATEVACEIGLAGELVGVSADSDWPPEVRGLPMVTRPAAPGVERTVRGDRRRLLAGAAHGYAPDQVPDMDALSALAPDLILGQERCPACGEVVRPIEALLRDLAEPPATVSLEPVSIEGILNTITTVGAMTETEDDAIDLVEALRDRLLAVEQIVEARRDAGRPARRVVALQQLDPPMAAGHWVPEQIRRAGGWELLGEPGGVPVETTWEAVRDVDPAVLVLMPAELDLPRAVAAWDRTPLPGFWGDIAAVHNGEVYLVDGPGLFARPGPRAIHGIELLAQLLDPDVFADVAPAGSWIRLG